MTAQDRAAQDGEIRFLGDLQRIQPEPGDVFVLTVDAHLSEEEAMVVRARWLQAMGDAQLLVLGPGMRLGCVAAPMEE
jgi:hypothetical protein